jgi:hypothetical protein
MARRRSRASSIPLPGKVAQHGPGEGAYTGTSPGELKKGVVAWLRLSRLSLAGTQQLPFELSGSPALHSPLARD